MKQPKRSYHTEFRVMSLDDVGEKIGLSREGVCRIEKRAILKIQSLLRAKRIKKQDILPD